MLGLGLIFGLYANGWAGALNNLSYNGPVDDASILPALSVDETATFAFTAESFAGTGGDGIPTPTLQLIDVGSNNPITGQISDCDSPSEVAAIIGRPLTSGGACIVRQLNPGAYALRVVDANGVSGNVLASITQDQGDSGGGGNGDIAPGTWEGGNEQTEDPFYACLHVSEDGSKLTQVNTGCITNDQNMNRNALNIEFQGGKTPDGLDCNNNGWFNQDIPIVNNSFSVEYDDGFVNVRVNGTFSGNTVSGNITVLAKIPNITCGIDWSANAP